MGIRYATREQILDSLEITQSAYAGSLIDAKNDAASRSIEGFLHRRFYPEQRTILRDWPNRSSSYTWEIELDDNEIISLTQVLTGDGTNITANVLLRRGDDKAEPPYSSIEVDLSTNSAFSAGNTFQQAISIGAVFGADKDTDTTLSGAALSGAINSSATTIVLNPVSGYYTPGVGSLLLCGTERLVLMDRRMSAVTGQTLSAAVTSSQADRLIGVTDGTAFATKEIILIDGERMRIDDIAGNNLIVTRAWDGSALDDHLIATQVYALRTFLAQRGALGSTAASHSDAAAVYVHAFPGLINELCIAETVVLLGQNSGGYAHMAAQGRSPAGGIRTNRMAAREVPGLGLEDIRERAWIAYGRKARKAAI